MPRLLLVGLLIAQVTQQCGSSGSSGSSGGSVNNVLSVTVNGGPQNNYPDGLFTAVTVCVPGTSTCQTISGILVDTGSTGLRILDSALTLSLPQQTAPNGGGSLAECVQYLDGSYTWGPIQNADIKMAGEVASNAGIQVIGESRINVPQQCALGGTANDTQSTLGANGILGVGVFREDCGPACTVTGIENPGMYYACPSSGCVVTTVSNSQQLQHPVALYSGSDNNGVLIQLPSVPLGGAATVTGSMIFGIGSQSNNSLGSATVQTTDGNGNFTTVYGGRSYAGSFIDSGSNGLFFLDSPTTGLALCPGQDSSFYCPPRTQSFSATNRGANGPTTSVSFNIGNADALNGNFNAFQELGGPEAGLFDWGLPFFFGRNVFVAIEGTSAPGGTPPYWAY